MFIEIWPAKFGQGVRRLEGSRTAALFYRWIFTYFTFNEEDVVVEPLDGSGNPIKSFSVRVKNGNITFKIGEEATVWYYLTLEHQ